jgi:predicted DCC family thiol-disulfide oxidoreductase YuxK
LFLARHQETKVTPQIRSASLKRPRAGPQDHQQPATLSIAMDNDVSGISGNELAEALGVEPAAFVVIYDGQCVFCSAYVRMLRLRDAVGPVHLLDARDSGRASLIKRETGLDLDEGMLAIYGNKIYSGADALHFLSLTSSPIGIANRAFGRLFRSERLSKALYPVLRLGRIMTLRLLRRPAIQLPE